MIRLELTPGRVSKTSFRWVLRLCKQQPTYRSQLDAGLVVHSVEFDEQSIPAFTAIYERVAWWKNTAVHIDGQLVDRGECWKRLDEFTRERRMGLRRVRQLIDEILRPYDGGTRF